MCAEWRAQNGALNRPFSDLIFSIASNSLVSLTMLNIGSYNPRFLHPPDGTLL